MTLPSPLSIQPIHPISLPTTLFLSILEVFGLSALSFIYSFCCFFFPPSEARDISLLHSFQAGCRTHILSYPQKENCRPRVFPTRVSLVLKLRRNAVVTSPSIRHHDLQRTTSLPLTLHWHTDLALSMCFVASLESKIDTGECGQWRTQEFCSGWRGGSQQIQLRTEDREKGDLGR